MKLLTVALLIAGFVGLSEQGRGGRGGRGGSGGRAPPAEDNLRKR